MNENNEEKSKSKINENDIMDNNINHEEEYKENEEPEEQGEIDIHNNEAIDNIAEPEVQAKEDIMQEENKNILTNKNLKKYIYIIIAIIILVLSVVIYVMYFISLVIEQYVLGYYDNINFKYINDEYIKEDMDIKLDYSIFYCLYTKISLRELHRIQNQAHNLKATEFSMSNVNEGYSFLNSLFIVNNKLKRCVFLTDDLEEQIYKLKNKGNNGKNIKSLDYDKIASSVLSYIPYGNTIQKGINVYDYVMKFLELVDLIDNMRNFKLNEKNILNIAYKTGKMYGSIERFKSMNYFKDILIEASRYYAAYNSSFVKHYISSIYSSYFTKNENIYTKNYEDYKDNDKHIKIDESNSIYDLYSYAIDKLINSTKHYIGNYLDEIDDKEGADDNNTKFDLDGNLLENYKDDIK